MSKFEIFKKFHTKTIYNKI